MCFWYEYVQHVGGDTSSEDDVLPPSLSGGDVVWVSPGMYIKAPGVSGHMGGVEIFMKCLYYSSRLQLSWKNRFQVR